jgi:hypothetical protein
MVNVSIDIYEISYNECVTLSSIGKSQNRSGSLIVKINFRFVKRLSIFEHQCKSLLSDLSLKIDPEFLIIANRIYCEAHSFANFTIEDKLELQIS